MGMSLVYSLADLLFQSIGTRWTNARELIRLATIGRRDAGGRDGKRLQVFHTNSEGRALGIKCHISEAQVGENSPRRRLIARIHQATKLGAETLGHMARNVARVLQSFARRFRLQCVVVLELPLNVSAVIRAVDNCEVEHVGGL